ncbi:hypothetical protein [Burkholderia gladioli]|uniref:hypothetical protein n=1 Tax=Burkholderia gladioli TaxID=28095 RepID=UPI00264E6A69|nr:hypothetical protein [Burkholderia gladioli]MDN7804121.1 hypothetical protein [Burkholderia gladioli]
MTNNQKQIQAETRNWMIQYAPYFTHAVTLTMKQSRTVMTNRGQTVQRLTMTEAKENFRKFVRRLNAAVYGNAADRFGTSIYVIPVIEGIATDKGLHYHCMMGNFRDGADDALIASLIWTAWQQTDFGNIQIDVQPMYGDGWIDYITKEVGIGDADNVDYGNVHVPKE